MSPHVWAVGHANITPVLKATQIDQIKFVVEGDEGGDCGGIWYLCREDQVNEKQVVIFSKCGKESMGMSICLVAIALLWVKKVRKIVERERGREKIVDIRDEESSEENVGMKYWVEKNVRF